MARTQPSPTPALSMPPVGAPAGWQERRGTDFSIRRPAGWFITTEPMTSMTGATEILTLATFDLEDIPAGGDDCSQVPEAAIEAMGDRDALLNLFNIYSTPADLHVGEIARWPEHRQGVSVAIQGCADNSAELIHYWFAFRAGRYTYRATVVFGRDVDDNTTNSMLQVLNSFRPDHTGPVEGWIRVLPRDETFGGAGDQVAVGLDAGPSGFVAVGVDSPRHDVSEDDTATVWTSPDGQRWTRIPSDPSFRDAEMTDVTWYEPTQLWVAVGHQVSSGAIWVSPDGARWRQAATLDPQPAGGVSIQAVVSIDSGLVAVGRDWLGEGHSAPTAWTSPDGETWHRSEVAHTTEAGEAAMVDIAKTGSGLVAVGVDRQAPAVWSSPDGRAWTPIRTGDAFGSDVSLTAVAGDADRIVAVGHAQAEDVNARAWTSTDGGRSWRGIEVETGSVAIPELYDVVVTPHGWIAVGADGSTLRPDTIAAVWSSSDGVEWHRHEPRGPQLRPQDRAVGVVMRAVAFRDGTFAAVGYQGQQCASRHSRCELDTAAWVSNRPTPSR